MFLRAIDRLFLHRHFWRYATFSEIAELYASRMMRTFALRLVAVFTSVYLYQEGFDLVFIALIWAAFYGIKILAAWPSAMVIAWFGPKHGTLYSNVLAALSMAFLPFVNIDNGIWAIVVWGSLQAVSSCLYDMCYLVGFSKVKSAQHAGKEIGYMSIIDKVAASISPLIGGFMAFLYGPHSVMILSSVLFLASTIPLFRSGEPVKIRQKVSFAGYPWRQTWRSLRAETAVGFDVFASTSGWTLFMVVIVFAGAGAEVYAGVGILSSVAIIASLLAALAFGRLIDRRMGGELLITGSVLNSLVHAGRVFITTPIGVAFANILHEAASMAYAMSFTRGMFDTADISGKRLTYLFLIEVVMNLGAAVGALALAFVVWTYDEHLGLQIFFGVTALVVILIATPRFRMYSR